MKRFYLIFTFLFVAILSFSQIKENIGIMPDSYYLTLNDETDHLKLLPPSKELIKTEDSDSEKDGTMYHIGRLLPVNITTDNSGTWNILENGTKIWKLRMSSEGAKASMLYFEYFKLQKNSKLFVYSTDYSVILGPFTDEDNAEGWAYSIGALYGSDIIIEYILPENAEKQVNEYKSDNSNSDFKIESYSYIYRGEYLLFEKREKNTGYGASDNCQVNINCSEGDNWRVQQKGVARIIVRDGWASGYCTGSLINNTENDQTPYLLTAAHCGETATTSNFKQWKFDFHYESAGCSSTSEPSKTSFTGCEKKSMGDFDGGSDFLLVKLTATSAQLKNAKVVYNGWNNANTASSSGVSIHHPSGDIKKISTYTKKLTSSTYYGQDGTGASNAHWRVSWAKTANGHGVTEGGSSGSPIFDNAGYIVGTLTGGSSYCTNTTGDDLYGKFSYHWESNGTTNSKQLKHWLDPNNTGVGICEILDPNNDVYIDAEFSANDVQVCENDEIKFTDLSQGEPTSWSWDFGDGSTSDEQNPVHKYKKTGTYTITLNINKDGYSRTKTKTNYVTVNETPEVTYRITDAVSHKTSDGVIELSVSKGKSPYTYSWSHDNSLNSNIAENLLPGFYSVTVNDANECAAIKEEMEIESLLGIEDEFVDFSIFPNPAKNVMTIKFDSNDLPKTIHLYNLVGQEIYQSKINTETIKLDVNNYKSGTYLIKVCYNNKVKAHKIIIE